MGPDNRGRGLVGARGFLSGAALPIFSWPAPVCPGARSLVDPRRANDPRFCLLRPALLGGRGLFLARRGDCGRLLFVALCAGDISPGAHPEKRAGFFLDSPVPVAFRQDSARTAPAQWALLGAILALLALTRENALIWLFVVPPWIWFHFAKEQRRRRLEWIFLFLAGLAVALFPVGLRNWQAGGEFTLTTAQMGANFYIGNNPSADGTYMPLKPGHGDPEFERRDATEIAEQALGRSLIPREVSNYWLRRSWDYVSTQPLAWLRLMGKKWLIVWNIRELEDAEDFYLYQKWSWLLR